MTSAHNWSGRIGNVWAAEWQRTDRSFVGLVPHLNEAILAAAPAGCSVIVDIGCGAGATSLSVATSFPNAEVTGIDLSAELLAVARDRIGAPNVRFLAGDAASIARDLAPVNLYVSRHGVMFFADPVATFTDLAAAGRPGTALVFSCFAEREANAWVMETTAALGASHARPAGPGPFAFADPGKVAAILAAAGWHAEPPRRIAYRYVAGEGADPVSDAVNFFGRIGPAASLLAAASPGDRPVLRQCLAEVCTRHRTGNVVDFPATAWIWSAHLPSPETAP